MRPHRRYLEEDIMMFILHDILTRGFLSLYLPIHSAEAITTIDPYILQIPLCAGTASPTKTCSRSYCEAGRRAATVPCVCHLCPVFPDFSWHFIPCANGQTVRERGVVRFILYLFRVRFSAVQLCSQSNSFFSFQDASLEEGKETEIQGNMS